MSTLEVSVRTITKVSDNVDSKPFSNLSSLFRARNKWAKSKAKRETRNFQKSTLGIEKAIAAAFGGTLGRTRARLDHRTDSFIVDDTNVREFGGNFSMVTNLKEGAIQASVPVNSREGKTSLITTDRSKIVTGRSADGTEKVENVDANAITLLREAKTQSEYKTIIGNDATLRKGLMYKANGISIPVFLGKKIEIYSVNFKSWNQVARNKNLRVNITKTNNENEVMIDLSFSTKFVNEVINATNRKILAVTNSQLAKIAKVTNGYVYDLQLENFKQQISYVPGSTRIKKGKASTKGKEKGKKGARARTISSAQFSALVRKRMLKVMPSGPVGGKPKSDTELTHRTHRFVNSVQLRLSRRDIDQKTKRGLIEYWYKKIYEVHLPTRNPDTSVYKSAKAVAWTLWRKRYDIQPRDA